MASYEWIDGRREISGFGGSYEIACRAMVSAGARWLAEHPEAKAEFSLYEGVTGIINATTPDAKEMIDVVVKAAGDDPTGAMVQYSVLHALRAAKLGWPEYMAFMVEKAEN